MSEQNNEKANALLDEIYETFSIVLEDGESRIPGSYKEIKKAEELLNAAKAEKPQDPEVIEQINQVEHVLAESQKRKFAGSKWIMIVLGLFILFMMYTGVYDTLTRENTVDFAKRALASQVKTYSGMVTRLTPKAANNQDFEDDLEYAKEQLAKYKSLTPEEYKDELDSRDNSNAFGNLIQWGIWLALLAAYFVASKSPQWLIDKRNYQMSMVKKGSGFLKGFIFSVLGIFLAMPSVTETRVHWTDGSKSTEYGFEGLIIKIIALVVIVAFIIWAMMFALPWLIVINYLRNYQFEKVDEFFDNIMSKFRSKKAELLNS